MLKEAVTCRADSSQYLSQPQMENWPKTADEDGKEPPGELTKVVRITVERADGKSARSDAEFVPQFSCNGSDGACRDPEEGKIKVWTNKDEAADGRLDLSDAELVQNFSASETMPLSDYRDRRRDWDVLSPGRRPGI